MTTDPPSRPSAHPVVFLVQRIGPYHEARLRALAGCLQAGVAAVEFRPGNQVYAWDPVKDSGAFPRQQLGAPEELGAALARLAPSAVVCVGYADPEIQRAVRWSLRRRVPLVVCSDSNFDDEPRTPAKERLKRCLLAAFDGALVAGTRSDSYLQHLGVEAKARFRPWDVVDNGHFERGAAAARQGAAERRAALGLPARYFFCSARFVAKKNLAGLLVAYRDYAKADGISAWSLVLAGGGPLEGTLRSQAHGLGVGDRVHFVGFVQYRDLPAYYGLAGALVLPSLSDQWGLVVNEAMAAGLPVVVSRRCGCAPDLVREGKNGMVFGPEEPQALARALRAIAGMAPGERAAWGECSRSIIAAYTPEAFARGLAAAIECARSRRSGGRRLAQLVAAVLAARRVPAA